MPDSSTTPVIPLPTPIKGRSDWRSYRALRLGASGPTIVLIQDVESKTLAAAATAHVGAAADPRSRSGLAHFCEHMCFLGSHKYPGENEYKQYLSQHGGRSNASTSMHATTYKFEILAEFGDHILDVFAQFFVDPLFTESGTGREVRAVDSENSKNLVADGRRRLQVLKALGSPGHYYTKFTTGNQNTLPTEESADELRQELLDFHRLHYRPDQLTVVVAGPQSLDELQQMVVPKFAAMKARPFPTDRTKMTASEQLVYDAAKTAPGYGFHAPLLPYNSPFGPDQGISPSESSSSWPLICTNKPLRSLRKLCLLFPVPVFTKNADQSPTSVLSHILGHEGPESVFAVLQNRGWISSLSAGPRVSAPDFGLFQIDLSLTPEGEAAWTQVVPVVLKQCRQLRQVAAADNEHADASHLRRLWDESAQLARLQFETMSPTGVYDTAPRLAQSVLQHGTAQALAAGSLLQESAATFPLDSVRECLEYFKLENMMIERCSEAAWEEAVQNANNENAPDQPTLRREPWYDMEFYTQSVNDEIIQKWRSTDETSYKELGLPSPNRFMPESLELCPDLPPEAKERPRIDAPMDPPVLLESNDRGRLWHRLDDRYALPKAVVHLLVRNAAVQNEKTIVVQSKEDNGDRKAVWQASPRAAIHASLVSACFSEALAQETYDANLAGLYWHITMGESGITLTCSGFSDRLADLAIQILREFLGSSPERFLQERFFASARDRLLRNLETYLTSRRADSHAAYYRDLLLSSESQGLDASIQACREATVESLKQYHNEIWKNPEQSVDCLYAGNVSEGQARKFYADATNILSKRIPTQPSSNEEGKTWVPGGVERRIEPGQSYELHFASLNPKEENGAVTVTYQSNIPSFRGDGMSTEESLESTACIRLLSHILREPLFNELRTKQTLGYIVSSYYDLGIANRPAGRADLGPLCVPVDLLEISVLSRKLSPPDIARRIDAFLHDFREHLVQLPESEIEDHVTALSTKLLKPIQKLQTEASTQFSKIRRYAPEVPVQNGGTLPWTAIQSLAQQIRSTDRQALLDTWDRLMLPHSHARVVTHVYGTTFPLQSRGLKPFLPWSKKVVVVDSIKELVTLRRGLPAFDNAAVRKVSSTRGWLRSASAPSSLIIIGAAATAAAVGWTVLGRSRKAAS